MRGTGPLMEGPTKRNLGIRKQCQRYINIVADGHYPGVDTLGGLGLVTTCEVASFGAAPKVLRGGVAQPPDGAHVEVGLFTIQADLVNTDRTTKKSGIFNPVLLSGCDDSDLGHHRAEVIAFIFRLSSGPPALILIIRRQGA